MLAVGIAAAFWVFSGLSDFTLDRHRISEVSFGNGGAVLSGTLVMPMDVANPPIAILVHGDGAQDRFSEGGYLPLINTLVDAGIGVFSWDKPGVGASTGNWLHQTMDDRADEALAALLAVSELEGIDPARIGLFGFSQAGWVLPRVATRTTPAFTVVIGGAVSWRDQGTYYNRVRLESEGVADYEIERRLAERIRGNDAVFTAPADPSRAPDIPNDRFLFVAGAYWEDVTGMIGAMRGPVLAVWGEGDLNVDAQTEAAIYKSQLAPLSEIRRVTLVPNATHGLLRAGLFNYQLSSDWPWYLQYVYAAMGRRAYAADSYAQITDWIAAVTSI